MKFITDKEKSILLSAISREEKIIKENNLNDLIPVTKQLHYYFMYDRLFKSIYNKGKTDMRNELISEMQKDNSSNLVYLLHIIYANGISSFITCTMFKIDDGYICIKEYTKSHSLQLTDIKIPLASINTFEIISVETR
mgnify:CR=1 FL=1